MSDATDYFENLVANIFRATSVTAPATIYAALFTAAPSDTGGGTEVGAGVGYSRQAVTFGAPSPAGLITSTNAPTFGPNTNTNWGSITHICLFDASSAGNMLTWKAATVAKTVNIGDSYTIPIGSCTLQVQ